MEQLEPGPEPGGELRRLLHGRLGGQRLKHLDRFREVPQLQLAETLAELRLGQERRLRILQDEGRESVKGLGETLLLAGDESQMEESPGDELPAHSGLSHRHGERGGWQDRH